MKNTWKKALTKVTALTCAALMVFGVGCKDNPDDPSVESESYKLWTTYHTMKVLQDSSKNGNYEQMPVGINLEMAKNEREMGSFYVTAGTDEIESFNLTVSELTNANGDKFPTEQMEIFAQKYVDVRAKSKGNTVEAYPLGWTPDPLVPLELYIAEGEGKIAAKKNQGISVDFTTTKDTPAGTYTGTFTLTLDDKTENIPVSVEVWDFALPEKSASDSCVLLYERQVRQAEGASADTDEYKYWYRTYFEQALDYKMCLYMVPDSLKGADAFLADVKKYWNHPNFATYGMPHQTFINSSEDVYMQYYRDCLYTFAVASAQDKEDYLERTYFYPIDEPSGTEALNSCVKWIEDLRDLMQEVQDRIEQENVFAENGCSEEFTEKCKNSLLNIEIVITAYGDEQVLNDKPFSYCPTMDFWSDTMATENIINHAEEFGTKRWYYNYVIPSHPAPTVHIDDYWLSTRLMKWVQKANDLDAYLYYDYLSVLTGSVKKQNYHGANRYDVVNKLPGLSANGDGFFVYPAAKYEADKPIVSMRLLAYRDGQDDLDILNYLDSFYSEYETYYGLEKETLDVNEVVKGLYDRLLCNINVFSDECGAFNVVRRSIKDLIINAQNEDNKFVYLIDYDGDEANYSFYTAPGYQVKVNGQALTSTASGQGLKHTYSMNFGDKALLSSVEIVKDGKSKTMELFESQSLRGKNVVSDNFTVALSEGSEVTKNNENKSLDFTIRSKDFGVGKEAMTLLFVPKIEFKSIGNFTILEYFCENKSDVAVEMKMIIMAADGVTISSEVGLPANTSRLISVQNRLDGKDIASVSIEFINAEAVGSSLITLGDRLISISDVRAR